MTSLLGFGGSAAHADPETLSPGNIQTDAMGSLTIHKHEPQTGITQDNPEKQASPADGDTTGLGRALQNVKFKVVPITGLDLKTYDGWVDLSHLTVSGSCTADAESLALKYDNDKELGSVALGTAQTTDATAADGSVKVSNLAVGAYAVCELDSTDVTAHDAQGATQDVTIADKAAPFIVTIPRPEQNQWLYDVHAFPKNSTSTTPMKAITPQKQNGLGEGSPVEFTVSKTVPTYGTKLLTKFTMEDTLDAKLTLPSDVADAHVVVTVDGQVADASWYDVTISGQKITIAFKGDGLTALNNSQGKVVEFKFQATSVQDPLGDIPNTATVITNKPGSDEENKEPTNEVITKWGKLRIQKTDSRNPATSLKGAIFEVYEAKTPFAESCTTEIATPAEAISVKEPNSEQGKTQFTSNDEGVVEIAGLFVADENDAKAQGISHEQFKSGQLNARCYVLKEVAAPAGYVLPEGEKALSAIKITSGQLAEGEYSVGGPNSDGKIPNTKQPVPDLPLTGANGQVSMAVAAGCLAVVTGGLVVARNRRRAVNR